MKILEIDYTTSLEFSAPVNDHYFLLRCVPVSRDGQTVISRNLTITPETPLVTSRDIFGNVSYQGRIDFLHDAFSFHSTATIMAGREKGCRDTAYPFYKYNTPLTQASPQMREFLLSLFDGTALREQVLAKTVNARDFPLVAEILRKAVHGVLEYSPGSTTVRTTASQAFSAGKGVCQDYSHIFCSLCREAGIPSRYVAGTSMGEGSTHAWAEYFIPDTDFVAGNGTAMQGRWYGADCTRDRSVDDTYVILASGRDYLDCKVDGGIFRGPADQKMTVFVRTKEKEIRSDQSHGQAGSTSAMSPEEQIDSLRQKNQQQQM